MLFKKKKRHKNKLNFLPIITLGIIGFIYFLSVSYSEKWNFEWKGIRKEIKDSIQALDKFGNLTSEFAGYNMNTPKQWHRQNWLRKNINTFELLKLTEYPSGTVKGFAYEELLTKPNIEKYELYKKTLFGLSVRSRFSFRLNLVREGTFRFGQFLRCEKRSVFG
jgi:hypothetical protein